MKCLLQTEKWDQQKAYIFSDIFRCIDDPCTFSNDIYPDKLILKKEKDDPCPALLLDILVNLRDKVYH